MQKFRRLYLIIAFSSLLLLLTFISETYAKYKTDATGTTNMSIARWNLIVNNQDIINYSNFSNVLSPTFINSPHVKNGVIAPKVVGYFDIVINYNNVDVSFNYKINTNVNINSSVSDIIITGYSLNGGDIIPVDKNFNELSGIGYLTDQTKMKSYRIYITWSDDDTDSMNNKKDTLAALSGINASFDVSINFTQLTTD